MAEASIESDGITVFVVYNGIRIAKRADPNTPQAGIWVSLEPGYRVFYRDYPGHQPIAPGLIFWRFFICLPQCNAGLRPR